ncbi:MAG: hypothetical protein DBX67_01740 [Desulfovibrionaceae bacterium]|nr:MAG: hypothetical protein DBX67_01740 [Desulfovibrionaceae bacterium]
MLGKTERNRDLVRAIRLGGVEARKHHPSHAPRQQMTVGNGHDLGVGFVVRCVEHLAQFSQLVVARGILVVGENERESDIAVFPALRGFLFAAAAVHLLLVEPDFAGYPQILEDARHKLVVQPDLPVFKGQNFHAVYAPISAISPRREDKNVSLSVTPGRESSWMVMLMVVFPPEVPPVSATRGRVSALASRASRAGSGMGIMAGAAESGMAGTAGGTASEL